MTSDDLFYQTRFNRALDKYRLENHERFNIGTYKEKTLHMVLKYFFCPDSSFHEIKYKGYVCDIKNDEGITEIQTGSFDKMRAKLATFLAEDRVNVVYPIIYERYVNWIDPDTSEVLSRARYPRRKQIFSSLEELTKIREFLTNENLTITLMSLKAEDFRLLDGAGENKKLRATKYDRVPVELVSLMTLHTPSDYEKLIPPQLPDEFTVPELRKIMKIKSRQAYFAVNALFAAGALIKGEMRGKAQIYVRASCVNTED